MTTMNVEELLKVFAQTEDEQAVYFPEYNQAMVVNVGSFEVTTMSSRLVALCALAHLTKRAEVCDGEMGIRFAEIAAISNLIIQVSGIYEWLVWHPMAKRADADGVVDPTIYEVWSIVRRLCRDMLRLLSREGRPQSFPDLFFEIVDAPA